MDPKTPLVKQLVVVAWKGRNAEIVKVHPPNDEPPKLLPEFCFPDAADLISGLATKCTRPYTFALTNVDGNRLFGFCKRIYQPGSPANSPICVCILSHFPWFNVFEKALHIVEMKFNKLDEVEAFIDAAVRVEPLRQAPNFSINVLTPNRSPMHYDFQRPVHMQPFGQASFEMMIRSLATSKIMGAFGALIRERRIIVVSDDLHRLSYFIFSLVSLLYPLSWQHIFIPIIAHSLLNYCAAPMPFLIGIHASLHSAVLEQPLEEVVFIVLDENKCVLHADDDLILPEPQVNYIRNAINHLRAMMAVNGYKPEDIIRYDKTVAEAVEKFWLETIGQYRRYFEKDQNNIKFNKNLFINQAPKSVKTFLEIITSTQMFDQFLLSREHCIAHGLPLDSPFERQVESLISQPLPDNSTKIDALKSIAVKATQALKSKMEDVKRSAAQLKDDIFASDAHTAKSSQSSAYSRPIKRADSEKAIQPIPLNQPASQATPPVRAAEPQVGAHQNKLSISSPAVTQRPASTPKASPAKHPAPASVKQAKPSVLPQSNPPSLPSRPSPQIYEKYLVGKPNSTKPAPSTSTDSNTSPRLAVAYDLVSLDDPPKTTEAGQPQKTTNLIDDLLFSPAPSSPSEAKNSSILTPDIHPSLLQLESSQTQPYFVQPLTPSNYTSDWTLSSNSSYSANPLPNNLNNSFSATNPFAFPSSTTTVPSNPFR